MKIVNICTAILNVLAKISIAFLFLFPFTFEAQFLGSRSGDEAALEALYVSANGSNWSNNSGWSSSGMSLADNIYGVEVTTIDGELRVTAVDLHDNGLTGSIDVPEIGNLSKMRLFAVTFNNLNSRIPPELGSCTSLEYLYFSRSDDVEGKDTFPHEHAQIGGGDVHVGKSKGSEGNVFTGPVPPELGNLSNLKWFILNWTDSSEGATDGISSVPVELFNITTLEGLQIYDNNGISEMPFPEGIANMTKLDNLALGVEKAGNKTGWVTGSVPNGFGELANLRFVRLNENTKLTLDFDQVDLSGMTALRNFDIPFIDLKGTFPSYFLDGTLPNLKLFNMNFPQNGTGLTGQLSSGTSNLIVLNVGYGNHIGGTIPSQLWNDITGLINTEFYGNEITSLGTDDLTNLQRIRNLRFANNNIGPERWPTLAWGTSQLEDLSRIDFSGNRYVFENMLWKPANGGGKTIFELYQAQNLSSFSYGNQQPFGSSATLSVSAGGSLTIDNFESVVTHADNVYQWQKDGSDISGATDRTLTISGAEASDAGTYRLVVTNPGVPNLTLISEEISVQVN